MSDSESDAGSGAGAGAGAGAGSRPSRDRKAAAVERFGDAEYAVSDKPAGPEIRPGAGTKLSDMPGTVERVEKEKASAEVMKRIHLLFYSKTAKPRNIKANILAFSGLPDCDDEKLDRIQDRIEKYSLALIKWIFDTLDIDRSAASFAAEGKTLSKDDLIERLVYWIEKPKPNANPRAQAKPPAKKAKKDGAGKGGGSDSPPPKRSKTAWVCFSTAQRAKVQEANPDLSFGDVAKKLSDMWKELSDADKAPYEAEAAKDKARYDEEKEEYDSTHTQRRKKGKKTKKKGSAKSPAKAKKSAPAKRKRADSDNDDSDSDDDVPLAAAVKGTEPAQIKAAVPKALSSMDLASVTMKLVRASVQRLCVSAGGRVPSPPAPTGRSQRDAGAV